MEQIIRIRVQRFIKGPAVEEFVKKGVRLFALPNPDFAKFWKEVNDAQRSHTEDISPQ